MESRFRNLPSVNDVLDDDRVSRLVQEFSHEAVLGLVRAEIDRARDGIRNGDSPSRRLACRRGREDGRRSLWGSMPTPVINATGVILHTNLGRAPLSDDAMDPSEMV